MLRVTQIISGLGLGLLSLVRFSLHVAPCVVCPEQAPGRGRTEGGRLYSAPCSHSGANTCRVLSSARPCSRPHGCVGLFDGGVLRPGVAGRCRRGMMVFPPTAGD